MEYKVFDIVNADVVFSSDNKDEALNFMAENCEKYGCLILIDMRGWTA